MEGVNLGMANVDSYVSGKILEDAERMTKSQRS
jgi:hypothetical protein